MGITNNNTIMTQQEYNNICAEINCILSELEPDFNDDDPRVERLIDLSNKADEYYKEQHTEGYMFTCVTIPSRSTGYAFKPFNFEI